jgi:hypothetical protein
MRLLALLAAFVPLSALAAEQLFTGTARRADGSVAYLEEHRVQLEGDRLVAAETRYLDAAGQPIARLASDYSRDPFAPDYSFEDLRSGTEESVRLGPGGAELRAGERRLTVALPPGGRVLVAGQGLDRFARHHLAALERGEELQVRMALPSRLDTYGFRLRAVARPGADPDTILVRIEPSSALLRLLAPAIEAEYRRQDGRLLRYRGVSNLADADGRTLQVDIRYAYPDHDVAVLR